MTQPRREGAPKTETPEKKAEAPPEETPRDEEAPLETPEEPLVRDETRIIDLIFRADLMSAFEEPVELKPSKPTPLTPATSEIAELYRHVADNPVDSHAPVWTGRTPNSP